MKYDDECYGDNWDVYVLKYSKNRPDDNMKAVLDNLLNNWIRDDYLAHYTLRDNADGDTMDTYIVSLRLFKMLPNKREIVEKDLDTFDIRWELNPNSPYNAWILKGDIDQKRNHIWCMEMHELSKLASSVNGEYDPELRMEFVHLFANNCFFHEDIQTKYSDRFGKVIIGPIYCDILNGYKTHPGVYYHNYNDKYEKVVEKYLKLKANPPKEEIKIPLPMDYVSKKIDFNIQTNIWNFVIDEYVDGDNAIYSFEVYAPKEIIDLIPNNISSSLYDQDPDNCEIYEHEKLRDFDYSTIVISKNKKWNLREYIDYLFKEE